MPQTTHFFKTTYFDFLVISRLEIFFIDSNNNYITYLALDIISQTLPKFAFFKKDHIQLCQVNIKSSHILQQPIGVRILLIKD